MLNKQIQILTILLFSSFFGACQNGDRHAYIKKYQDIAIREMERTGVPASIKLAQGILESNAGKSYLARKANNHFGMKCGSQWKGKKEWREDDDFDENGKLRKSCFRVYKNGMDSYIAHSEFLRDPRKEHRYGFLFRLNPMDYKRWARGLKQSGYATSATYDKKLIKVIETYELYKYDKMNTTDVVSGRKNDKVKEIPGVDLQTVNDIRVVFAKANDTPQDIALKTDTKLKCVLKYNEQIGEADTKLEAKTKVFIQPKRNGYRGKKKWHYIKAGDKMYDISQLYGVKLSKLYTRNLLPEGTEAAVGERIKLRGHRVRPNERPRLNTNFDEPEKPKPVEDEEEDPFMDEEITIEAEKPELPPRPEPPVIIPKEEPEPPEEPVLVDPEPPIVLPEPDPDPPADPEIIYHTVVEGDTLYNISRRFGLSVGELKNLNGLTSNLIRKGQQLRVK